MFFFHYFLVVMGGGRGKEEGCGKDEANCE
jgi:hypothetical protein